MCNEQINIANNNNNNNRIHNYIPKKWQRGDWESDACGPQPEQRVMDFREEKESVWREILLSVVTWWRHGSCTWFLRRWLLIFQFFFHFRLSKRVPMETQNCNMLLAIYSKTHRTWEGQGHCKSREVLSELRSLWSPRIYRANRMHACFSRIKYGPHSRKNWCISYLEYYQKKKKIHTTRQRVFKWEKLGINT